MTGETPPDVVRDLQRRAAELRRFFDDVVTGDERTDVRRISSRRGEMAQAFDRLERRTSSSVWNMQFSVGFAPNDPVLPIDERSRKRGLELRMLVAPVARGFNPLLPCVQPEVRVGPVQLPLMVLDERVAVLGGPAAEAGEIELYLVTHAETVRRAVELYLLTEQHSEPWDPSGKPPLTPRQYAVACHLAAGLKDDAIARTLRVSRRTVVAEVVVIQGFLGARSRFEAGAMIRGAYL